MVGRTFYLSFSLLGVSIWWKSEVRGMFIQAYQDLRANLSIQGVVQGFETVGMHVESLCFTDLTRIYVPPTCFQ